jgi:hypothetical protein
MPKKFYTECDIEELFANGIQWVDITGEVVLTELAYEKAQSLGIKLGSAIQIPPSAPVRPYLSKDVKPAESSSDAASPSSLDDNLRKRVREAVAARLGNQVDPELLDTIIQRILSNINL